MKRYFKYIILFLALLPLMTACVLDSDDPMGKCSKEVVVKLSVSSRAVTSDTQVGDGLPEDIKMWVYGQAQSTDPENTYIKIAYIQKSSDIFIGRDLHGNPVESIEQVIENGKDYYKLHFYVVLNSENVTGKKSGSDEILVNEYTTVAQLKDLTFTGIVQSSTKDGETIHKTDNQMIMYGYNSLTIGTQTNYELSIQVERAVAKLEFFVTKENSSASLTITEMKLNKIPDKGFLTTPATTTSGLNFSDSGISYLSEGKSIPKDKYLLQTEALLGNFWQFEESRFVKMPLTQPYLMENPYGGTWTDDNNKHDYTYPTTEGYKTEKGYVLTVSYQLGGSSEKTTQTIYLPKIERNHLYKIYARVLGGNDVQFTLKVANWDDVEITVPFNNIVSYTVTGWGEDNNNLYGYDYYIAKDGNAVLKFQINNPENCDYIVKLSDNTNFTYTKGKDGDNETITISPVNTEPEQYNGKEYETTLSVYAVRSDNGKLVELDMTKSGPSSTGSGTINHYTIKQQWTD